MQQNYEQLQRDIAKVKRISIVPTLLEVICRSTGMGFAAIARVTEDRWIACSVRDEVNFGLKSGDELKIETTICHEIRQSQQGVVIDNVVDDQQYCGHPTPQMYQFKSYISFPIILNSGEFFGTLCALDSNPALVSDLKITGMFTLFTQLIAFHLQAIDRLAEAELETKRYEHITYHSLREPVRKISLCTDQLMAATGEKDLKAVVEKATSLHRFSNELAGILKQLDNHVIN